MATLDRAIRALEQAEAKIAALEQRRDEAIAIVGLGCRFPHGRSPDSFWDSLKSGVDAISEIPESRWRIDSSLQKARWAALLDDDDVTGFDAAFFGMSAREAAATDPQHRLLLEVSIEALEDAGIPLESMRGSRTGVFAGMMTLDYQQLAMALPENQLDIYTSTGIGACFGSGRLSHLLGLEGPSVSTDTACSSSLVALHLACQSLRARECDLAMAGGVNLMLSPWTMRLFVYMQALSPEGRCRTFDARSNGFVRGEGCGVLVLKRVSDAIRDGDSIRALVRGSAVNHNGRSSGLTAPNVLSQQALLRQALAAGQVSPQDISYIEAHGIATPLGDPIEIEALKAVIGAPRPDGSICAIGSVKTNVGHLEAAAGIAGVIKTILALEHERIPPHLHFESLNPRISLQGTALAIDGGGRAWPRGARPRRAGVSAFGLSGTNAHVVLEEAPQATNNVAIDPAADRANAAADREDARPHLVVVTARSEDSLRRLAARHAELLERETAPSVRDVAYTTALRRSHHPHRLAVVGATRREIATSLREWLGGVSLPNVRQGRALPNGANLVFVYADHDAYWPGMGLELHDSAEAFRRVLDHCQQVFSARGATWSVLDVVRTEPERPERIAAAVFAIQVAMTAEWQARGVVPDRVVGLGTGELAAAHVAGILSLEAAADVIWRRCELVAQHGTQRDGWARRLETELQGLAPSAGQIALFSTMTGRREPGQRLDAAYWARQLCEPARFRDALAEAVAGEPSVVVQVVAHAGHDRVRAAASLRPAEPERRTVLEALADVFVAGGAVAWPRGSETGGRLARLPTYAWNLERHWIERSEGVAAVAPVARSNGVRANGAEANGAETLDCRTSPLVIQTWQPRTRGDSSDGGRQPGKDRNHRPATGHGWLVIGDVGDDRSDDWIARLASQLRAAGQAVTTWQWPADLDDDRDGAALEAALTAAFAHEDARGIVVCAGSGRALPDDTDGATLQAAVERACWAVASLARVAARRPWRSSAPRLWLITESSQPVASEREEAFPGAGGPDAPDASLLGAALWGVGRTIVLAHPELRCTGVDVEPGTDPALVASELLCDPADEELGLRGTSWYVGRLARTDRAPRRATQEPSRGRPFRLELDRAGILDHMAFRVAQVPPPGDGQVRIRVGSAGLNFMDVMTAMGIYPGTGPSTARETAPGAAGAAAPIVLGGECAGSIDAVGPGVTAFAVGDPVVAVGSACFGSYVTTDVAYVQRRPAELDAVLAGGVPIVFLTAWYALVTLGRLQAKERILIHSAATGVGLAAIQIAQWLGAEIYATAGTDDKRALLRGMRLAKVMDSRTQAFAAEVLAATGGEGVDMVLNSLSGAAIEASLAALAGDGRLFEIGKTDIYAEDRALQLSPFRKRLSYQAIDLLGLAQDKKPRFAALFGEVMDAFRAGVLRPLPTEAFDAARTTEAFARMASGRHTGKLVVAIAGAEVQVETSGAPAIDAHASYLVTGGSGALGLGLTEWLVDQGARRIVWLSRRGLAGASASHAARRFALRSRGVELRGCAGDVSRAEDVARAVAEAEAMGPLRGVVHAAGLAGDATLEARDRAGLSAVMAAKVAGAWNVHRATERAPLTFFVLCSSASALLGGPDRAHDAAANAFLDGLARFRRSRGQVALSVQWGPLVVPDAPQADGAIDLPEARQMLHALLWAGSEHAAVIRFNARQLIEYYPHLASGTRFLPLVAGDHAGRTGDPALLARMARANAAERVALIDQLIRHQLAQILRATPGRTDRAQPEVSPEDAERVDPDVPWKALGVDSLMGLELRNRLEAALGISLSAALIWAYPDLRSLGEYLLGRLVVTAPLGAPEPGVAEPRDLPDVRTLSDQQQTALIEQELASIERLLH